MTLSRHNGRAIGLSLLLTLSPAMVVQAGPWLPAGDLGLRHDITLLSDAGVIKAPITTWPIAWADISHDIMAYENTSQLNPATISSYVRVRSKVRAAMTTHEFVTHARVSASSSPRELRTFEATPRDNGEVEAALEWTGNRFAFNLRAQVVSNAQDDKTYRVDNSYIGVVLGNTMFSIDTQDRWWGPAWDGSTILSNNARSVPSIVVQRNLSTPFKTKLLSWLGPWTGTWIWGQMEDSRTVSNARLWGLRFAFRPLNGLEIGLSRTAQWCGAGRPCDFDTFVDLLKGTEDNRGGGVSLDDEPGNQLAAIDFRWAQPFIDWPIAFYGQFTAEDEAGGTPSRWIAQGGFEFWGESPFSWLPGSYRIHLELVDTAAEFYDDIVRFDYAYEHFIYQDGYRYRDRAIGHSIDSDSQMYSLGAVLNGEDNSFWQVLVRRVYLNRGGVLTTPVSDGDDTLWNVELSHSRALGIGRIDAGLGFDSFDSGGSDLDDEVRGFLQWTTDF